MHPEVNKDQPGECPICGMALEPVTPDPGEEEDPELVREVSAGMEASDIAGCCALLSTLSGLKAERTLKAVDEGRTRFVEDPAQCLGGFADSAAFFTYIRADQSPIFKGSPFTKRFYAMAAAFSVLWWCFMPRAMRQRFLHGLHERLVAGAPVWLACQLPDLEAASHVRAVTHSLARVYDAHEMEIRTELCVGTNGRFQVTLARS